MKKIPNIAFILAAGRGTRLQPYTDTLPKPMVSVWNKPILEHTINKCKKDGITNIIINLNYLGEKIENYFLNRDDINIHFSKEQTLLDTGGGVKYARDLITDDTFFLINGDAFWTEGEEYSAFQNLSNAWCSTEMDILILLQPISEMKLTKGIGDYNLDENGRAIRSLDKTGKYMFAGVRIAKSNVTNDIDDDIFSFLHCMDTAQQKQKLYGLVHEGAWHHISTPEDLDNVNAANPDKFS